MKAIFKNPNLILYSTIAIIIVLFVIFLIAKNLSKNKKPSKINIDVDETGTIPENRLSNQQIQNYTNELFEDLYKTKLNPWLSTSRNHNLYEKLNQISDADLIKISNFWDKNYYSKHKEKLFQAIQSEWSFFIPIGTKSLMQSLVSRLKQYENYR
jgi:hypothetical protein